MNLTNYTNMQLEVLLAAVQNALILSKQGELDLIYNDLLLWECRILGALRENKNQSQSQNPLTFNNYVDRQN